VLDAFERLATIVSVLERAPRRAVGVTVEGVPVELVVAEPSRFGTELLRATGTSAYVDALGDLPSGADEEHVYAALGVPWCPPELREGPFRGEPPSLLRRTDIRGDLHVHSTWSDRKASVLEVGVAGMPDQMKGESVKAWIVLRPGGKLDAAELKAFCKERLAPYKVPANFEFVSDLPKSQVGKVLRRMLRQESPAKEAVPS